MAALTRYLVPQVRQDLAKKMVFVAGPRQVGKTTLAKSDIDELQTSPVSMMPEGQLEKLTATELRDLVAYLRSPRQVPLPNE